MRDRNQVNKKIQPMGTEMFLKIPMNRSLLLTVDPIRSKKDTATGKGPPKNKQKLIVDTCA